MSTKYPTKVSKKCLKIYTKFTGEHLCRSVISIKLQSNFIEFTLRHGCPPGNLLHIFRTSFPWKTSRWLLLKNWVTFFSHATENYLRTKKFKDCDTKSRWKVITTKINWTIMLWRKLQNFLSRPPLIIMYKLSWHPI